MNNEQNKPNNKVETAEVLHEVAPEAALTLITKAEIDMQISTAKTFPRSLAVFHKKIETMATMTEEIAESCTYVLRRGGKNIEGPSIRFAEIVAAAYGNLRSGARVIFNDGKTVTAQGIVHDLENNVMHTEEVKRSILQHEYKDGAKTGKMVTMNEDMQVITGRAACAIAFRNAIFKVVPAALVQNVYEKVKEVAKGTEATLPVRRAKAIKFFTERNIKEAKILEVLGAKGVEDIDLEKMQVLSGMKAALANGEATLETLFEEAPGDKGKKATDKTLEKLNIKDAAKGTATKMEGQLKGGETKTPTS